MEQTYQETLNLIYLLPAIQTLQFIGGRYNKNTNKYLIEKQVNSENKY